MGNIGTRLQDSNKSKGLTAAELHENACMDMEQDLSGDFIVQMSMTEMKI